MLSSKAWHLSPHWCLVFVCLVTASKGAEDGEHFLQFVPAPDVPRDRFYYEYPGSVNPIEVDGAAKQQVRIRIVDFFNKFPELKLHCLVAPLRSDSDLSSALLCQRTSVNGKDTCADPKLQTVQFNKIKFDAIGNRTHGYTFTAELPVGKVLLDAYYFCKYRNKWGELISNMVEVQDVYHYQKALVERSEVPPRYLPTITDADLPLRLDCGDTKHLSTTMPSWADHNFPSPFLWSFCELSGSDKYTDYQCMNKVRKVPTSVSDYFEHVVYPNGTLILLGRTAAAWKRMGLLCRSHLRSSVIFSVFFGGSADRPGPLGYNPNAPHPDVPFRALSPTFEEVTVRQGPGSATQLVAVYQARRSSARTEWTKDGGRIPFGFPEPTDFALIFPEVIHRNHSGSYELRVSGRHPTLRFRFQVRVVGPPEVVQDAPELLLVMEGHEASFSTEIASSTSTALRINGEHFLPGNPSDQQRLIEQFHYFKDVRIHPLEIQGSRIQYRASNLMFHPGSPFGSTHTVTIEGANEFGYARVSTLINVLPRPTLLRKPMNCTHPCLSNTEHVFMCEIDSRPYAMAHIEQSWDWNGTDIDVLHKQDDLKAAFLKQDGNKLRLLPVEPELRVSLFANSYASCRIRIYYKEFEQIKHQSQDWKFSPQSTKWLVYDSKSDPKMQGLSAHVDLQLGEAKAVASAGFTWIAGVLIAVVIIIIIGSLTACIVMRSRGETYLLDRKERASGHDPEKELLENKNFQLYERPDLPPLRGSRFSLNDYSAELGSDADGELDDYNLDPGKFNEEGSFIDQYTTETHYKSNSRLPTLSGQYQPLV